MCGRYTTPEEAEAERYFTVHQLNWHFSRSYNVAPSQFVPAVRTVATRREGTMMRWGLVPFFAKGIPTKYSTINARIETIETAASYRFPWKWAQRCILPSAGFFEWHVNDDGSNTPFFIHSADGPIFGFAGLWDTSKREDGSLIESCTIITMPAHAMMAQIHNGPGKQRMPAILHRDDHEDWLTGSKDTALAALKPYPADLMSAWPVSARVNSPRNEGPSLIERITSELP
jgi:putative SOS response-associated peptidase YedK